MCLKFNRPFEKYPQTPGARLMQHCGTMDRGALDRGTMDRSAIAPTAAPLFARLVSKLVLEVLPASLASMIGAVLLAHYHFGHPAAATAAVAAAAPAPASPEMLQLVREEHDLLRNFLIAQQAAQASRHATADTQSAQAAADAELAAAARRAANAVAAKAPARIKAAATASLAAPPAPSPAAALPAVAPVAQAPSAVAGLQNSAAPPAAPEHRSLMATILAVKDHVVGAPLHAVMAIGSIPSWLGHRLGGDDPDSSERMFSAAS
jgi:hypothetical protein